MGDRGSPRLAPVIVVGSAAVDEQIARDGAVRIQVGGVVTYGGATFVREGLRAIAVCNLDARSGAAVRAALTGLGVEVCAGTSRTLTRFQNRLLVDGGRQQQILGLADAIGPEVVARALEGIDGPHVHLGPLHGADISREAIDLVAARAGLITLDVQGFVRRGELGPVHDEVAPQLEAALAAANLVKADEAELDVVLKAYAVSAEQLVERFAIDELVVTAGSAGGYVVAGNAGRGAYRAVFAGPEGDTTGAGDVFFAAYVAARLHRGATSLEAAAHAATVAGQHVAGIGLRAADLVLSADPASGQ